MERTVGSTVGFYDSVARQLVETKLRTWIKRDRRYRIGDFDMVLPPQHRLPWFQRVFPNYDRYAADVLGRLTHGSSSPCLIDIGANVGDTAALAVSAVPHMRVIAVEGDAHFLSYLRRNARRVGSQVEVEPRFVAFEPDATVAYFSAGSTGGFQQAPGQVSDVGSEGHITVQELLTRCTSSDRVIWKSDTDGLDITILSSNWDAINESCDVIWFEFDPFLDVDDGARIPGLTRQLAESGRIMHVVDNTGRAMMTLPAAEAPSVLAGLTAWMSITTTVADVHYLDLWLVRPELATCDPDTGVWCLGASQR